MKAAILFSGELRGFKYIYEDLHNFFLNKFSKVDTFFYVKNNDYEIESFYNPTKILYQEDIIHNQDGIHLDKPQHIQKFISQWYSVFMSNKLRKEYSNEYDVVIRLRPDTKLLNEFNLNWIDLDKITVCSFGGYGGINDRFAIGNPENMDIYCNFYYNLSKFNGNSESKLFNYLSHNNVLINKIDYYWHRINSDGKVRENEE